MYNEVQKTFSSYLGNAIALSICYDRSKILERMVHVQMKSPVDNDTSPTASPLNRKEIGLIKLVAEGLSNSEIANQLHYSVGTVKNMISNILAKLYLKDRTQLAVFAIRNRLA